LATGTIQRQLTYIITEQPQRKTRKSKQKSRGKTNQYFLIMQKSKTTHSQIMYKMNIAKQKQKQKTHKSEHKNIAIFNKIHTTH